MARMTAAERVTEVGRTLEQHLVETLDGHQDEHRRLSETVAQLRTANNNLAQAVHDLRAHVHRLEREVMTPWWRRWWSHE